MTKNVHMFGAKNDHFLMLCHEGQLGSPDSELSAVIYGVSATHSAEGLQYFFCTYSFFLRLGQSCPAGARPSRIIGQGYSQAGTFCGVLNVSLRAFNTQLVLHLTCFVIRHPSSIVHHPPSVIHHMSSVIRRPSSVIHHLSSVACHPSSIIRHSSSVIHRPSSAICHRSSVIGHPSSVLCCTFFVSFHYFFRTFSPYFLQN